MERAALRELVLATGRAEEVGEWVVLCDPAWGQSERAQWAELRAKLATLKPERGLGWLGVPTGGTSGRLKFARHDEQTLSAAVRGFCEHFNVKPVNAVDVLPAHHVSGLMARVRCAATGGQHVAWSWKELEAGNFPELNFNARGWFISLVPTQLQRLLAKSRSGVGLDLGRAGLTPQGELTSNRPDQGQALREQGCGQASDVVAWLKSFRAVLIGGGPLWPELANEARRVGLPLAPCYGMSETAAMVAAVLPEEFLRGEGSCGRVMPHAQIEMVDELVRLAGESVCRGYLGEIARAEGEPWPTEDLGRVDERGFLWIEGRRDAVIISGGKKIHPAEVEAVLRATGLFGDVAVIGLPDAEWGEVVTACFSPAVTTEILAQVRARAERNLAAYKMPKRWCALEDWPRNEQGKVRRAELLARAREKLGKT